MLENSVGPVEMLQHTIFNIGLLLLHVGKPFPDT